MRFTASPLWRRWTAANALGELFGLGGTFLLAAQVFTRVADNTTGAVLFAFALAVASGALEATVVGLLQWRVLRPALPSLPASDWWLATLAGALIAYVLGYLPSTLMSLGQDPAAAAAPVAEPPLGIVLLLSAGLGLVGGAVLSAAQWRVLRRFSPSAGWWVPANMLAWTVGMPIIFWGVDTATKGHPFLLTVGIMAAALLASGAIVGAIHGAFLVRILRATNVDKHETHKI